MNEELVGKMQFTVYASWPGWYDHVNYIGIATSNHINDTSYYLGYSSAISVTDVGNIYMNSSLVGNLGARFQSNTYTNIAIRVCVDVDAKLIWFRYGGTVGWNNTNASPSAGTGGISFAALT